MASFNGPSRYICCYSIRSSIVTFVSTFVYIIADQMRVFLLRNLLGGQITENGEESDIHGSVHQKNNVALDFGITEDVFRLHQKE